MGVHKAVQPDVMIVALQQIDWRFPFQQFGPRLLCTFRDKVLELKAILKNTTHEALGFPAKHPLYSFIELSTSSMTRKSHRGSPKVFITLDVTTRAGYPNCRKEPLQRCVKYILVNHDIFIRDLLPKIEREMATNSPLTENRWFLN
ncbi:hypothetical protein EB796_018372 [Bugula neritina]|uniref:Uncharacterized protein n=1 Tax=Bugula neritina TaxID=10212 RepID=A0A7J7JB90_BUGNE|nr:hypothetical protein EB796_018372 [Bugula neritina]